MDWDSYFDHAKRARYQSMANGGAIAMLKRDILLEAVRDVRFVYEVQSWFALNCGNPSFANSFTARVVTELIAQNLITLATWSESVRGDLVSIEKSTEELISLISQLDENGPSYLLAPTALGKIWVERYYKLAGELEVEWPAIAYSSFKRDA
jgi:hypothetical protein